MNRRTNTTKQSGFAIVWLAVIAALVIVVVAGVALIGKSSPKPVADPNACDGKSFAVGSNGKCVSDIQNMVNSQAFGVDGQLYVKVTGTYDATTVSAVKTFQKNFSLPQTGSIGSKDWSQLCNGDQTSATFAAASKDAGCSQ